MGAQSGTLFTLNQNCVLSRENSTFRSIAQLYAPEKSAGAVLVTELRDAVTRSRLPGCDFPPAALAHPSGCAAYTGATVRLTQPYRTVGVANADATVI
jgi:hypothetical protein